MTEAEGHEQEDGTARSTFPPPLTHRDRFPVQKNNVCSRSYFVVVMVFFHVYILNVIALLLYVHYNTGSDAGASSSSRELNDRNIVRKTVQEPVSHIHLPRIEGIRVGHVQKVSLVPGKMHEIKTLSLKPLLFEIPGFLSERECAVVMHLAQLKGLVESQVMVPEGQEELSQQLNISAEEIFHLLDLNQDGQLQPHEILTHSRVRDGIWLTLENLREIYAGLKVDRDGNGLLSIEEFGQLSSDAFQRFLRQRGLHRNQLVRNSRHTWLYQGQGAHQVLRDLRSRVTRLTRLPPALVELSEPLQVVRYEQSGHYHAHHDSGPVYPETTCTHTHLTVNSSSPFQTSCRYITVLFYLNTVEEGGETTFPVADNRTYDEVSLIQDDVDLLDTRKHCDKGNLRVKPTMGKALFWYNYLSDGNGWVGEQDEYALHGGCVVTRGVKWIANNWINVDPDYGRQARYEQLMSQQPELQEPEPQEQQHTEIHQDL